MLVNLASKHKSWSQGGSVQTGFTVYENLKIPRRKHPGTKWDTRIKRMAGKS